MNEIMKDIKAMSGVKPKTNLDLAKLNSTNGEVEDDYNKKLHEYEEKAKEISRKGREQGKSKEQINKEVEELWSTFEYDEEGNKKKKEEKDNTRLKAIENNKGRLFDEITEFLYLVQGVEKKPSMEELKASFEKIKKVAYTLEGYEHGKITEVKDKR